MFAVDDVILPRHFPERAIKIVRDFTHEWHRILLMVWVKYAYTTGKPGTWVYCLGLEGRSTEMETRSMYRTLSLVVAGPLKNNFTTYLELDNTYIVYDTCWCHLLLVLLCLLPAICLFSIVLELVGGIQAAAAVEVAMWSKICDLISYLLTLMI